MAYTVPDPATLKATYPAFANVADETIQLWLDRVSGASGSGGDVDQSWTEGDYGPAILAAAAHRMARAGVLGSGAAGGGAAAGVESFKSAGVSIQFSADAVKASVAGGWRSTPYGLDYYELLQRNRGGPRVIAGGCAPCGDGFNGFAGPFPPYFNC
jgi:hypothetical protein